MWTGFFPLIVPVQNLHETWASAVKLAQAPPLHLSLFFLPVPILTPQLLTPPVANKYLWLGGDYIWRGFGCWSWHRGTTAGLPALWNSYWNHCTTWWGKVVPERPGPLHLAAGGKWGARGNPKQAAKERFVSRELLVDAVVGHGRCWEGKAAGRSRSPGWGPQTHDCSLLNIEEQAFTRQGKSNILIDSFCCSKEKGLMIWLAKTICFSLLLFTAKESHGRML